MSSLSRSPTLGRVRTGRPGLLAMLAAGLAARRQRRTLRDLDDAMLRDIGLTRHEALLESQRPLWDVPAQWRR
ncbi:DUF1127 domain-containing protein [Oceaniglobus roseus]|uniref:DUF1127 domain-containing protein n=1 Tax=Oceaniglobus roseus TaxID=1737570 RepID=UPI000C7EDF4F|nr:DUF1127 domain-containing protein [Kandeliimicrobium roseum]